MKLYVVFAHEDPYERGPVTLITARKELAEKEMILLELDGYLPETKEYEAIL